MLRVDELPVAEQFELPSATDALETGVLEGGEQTDGHQPCGKAISALRVGMKVSHQEIVDIEAFFLDESSYPGQPGGK